MKDTIKFLGVIAMIAVIGFGMAGCNKANPVTDFEYEPSEDSKGMVITNYTGENVNAVIPAKIQKLPVVEVGGFYREEVISVVIPAGVKTISDRAFRDCSNLTSVTFKGNDVVIGVDAFIDCENLEKLVFPDGALKPYKYEGALGTESIFNGRSTLLNTEHYYYSPGYIETSSGWGVQEQTRVSFRFGFHSGANAFRNCNKLPEETLSKLKAAGFLSTEEMDEIQNKARRLEL